MRGSFPAAVNRRLRYLPHPALNGLDKGAWDGGKAGGGAIMALTVLLLHACQEVREQAAALLSDAGMQVRLAVNGIDGLAVLAGHRPDAIVTGINMPELDGFGFIEAVRRRDQLRAVPILVLTTATMPELRTRARNAGAAGWLSWPVDSAKLAETMRIVTA